MHDYPSLIYAARSGELKIHVLGMESGTISEVVKLGLTFVAFLAGILTLGTLM
jgi:hypothetical protein